MASIRQETPRGCQLKGIADAADASARQKPAQKSEYSGQVVTLPQERNSLKPSHDKKKKTPSTIASLKGSVAQHTIQSDLGRPASYKDFEWMRGLVLSLAVFLGGRVKRIGKGGRRKSWFAKRCWRFRASLESAREKHHLGGRYSGGAR